MPQMSPLNWMIMTIFFNFSLLISMMILFWNSFFFQKNLYFYQMLMKLYENDN